MPRVGNGPGTSVAGFRIEENYGNCRRRANKKFHNKFIGVKQAVDFTADLSRKTAGRKV
jgi:hypothetical protein